MSIRLCQECCQWVSTRDDRCPECHDALPETVNPKELDSQFRSLVGDVRRRIEHVRIKRRHLPTGGVLYETANGLFFLPYRRVTKRRLVEQTASSPMWTVASLLWAPLMFLSPFLKQRELREKDIVENEPIRLGKEDLQLLSDFLSRVPGTFFIPIRHIQSIRRKRRNWWVIERFVGTSISIQPIAGNTFGNDIQQFIDTHL